LREKLVETLDMPVHLFDPFAGAEGSELPAAGRGTFVGAVGLLHLMAARRELPVNFALIKQPKPPRDPNQRLHVLAACLLLVLLGGGFVLGQQVLENYRETVAEKDQELNDLGRQLAREREKAKRMEALHEWDGVPWPDELYELTASMPPIKPEFKVRVLEGSASRPPVKVRTPAGAAAAGVTVSALQEVGARPVAKFLMKLDSPTDTPLNELTAKLLAAKDAEGVPYYRPGAHKVARGIYAKDTDIRTRP